MIKYPKIYEKVNKKLAWFNHGDRVIINPNSRYFYQSKVPGTITRLQGGEHTFWVEWDNGANNDYRNSDLVPMYERCDVLYKEGHIYIYSNFLRNFVFTSVRYSQKKLIDNPTTKNYISLTQLSEIHNNKYNELRTNEFLNKIKDITNSKGMIKHVDILYNNEQPFISNIIPNISKIIIDLKD